MSESSHPAPSPRSPGHSHGGILAGRRILVTGVLTPKSIAFAIAEACQRQGAEVILTSFGRAMSITQRSAKRLDPEPAVLELDVTNEEDLRSVADDVAAGGPLHGIVHAIGFAPDDCLGGGFLDTPWASVATAFHVSSYSLQALARHLAPAMSEGGAIVTLTFDSAYAWPLYDWMGPAKAALESVARYLARDLGPRNIRVNSVAAGPLETMAAKSIPGFNDLKRYWDGGTPIGWDPTDGGPVADTTVFLLSPMARAITGELIHVDGGYHALGAPLEVAPQ